MSRKKNLLEAFQRSESSSAPSAGASSAHGPSSGSTAGSGLPLFERPPSAGRGTLRAGKPLAALVVIGLVLSFVFGYLFGRGSSGETHAEEKPLASEPRPPPVNQPRSFQERAPASETENGAGASKSAESAAPQRLEDSALFDARNTSTVVVAAYSKSNQDLAWATYEHLRGAKLAAFPPIASGNLVVVLVGAAPKDSELESTRNTVRALSRDGKNPYESAYIARIDKLIPRPTTKEKKP